GDHRRGRRGAHYPDRAGAGRPAAEGDDRARRWPDGSPRRQATEETAETLGFLAVIYRPCSGRQAKSLSMLSSIRVRARGVGGFVLGLAPSVSRPRGRQPPKNWVPIAAAVAP